jgi:hypothetical protein
MADRSRYAKTQTNGMQPPQMQASMPLKHRIAELVQQANFKNVAEHHNERNKLAHWVHQNRLQTDYKVLVGEWYNSIPPAARKRRYRSDELLHIFTGRYRDRPALRMIVAALRANGFTSHRDWSAAGRNSRYFLPPPDD